ncbi:MAG: glycogen synthase [Gammaproteobacteria bacterium]|nr:glycogen synthase [Gammaproteobacteria bacterium]MBU1478411.1 glycogen synthase [Gammaproteobacteria bacterium]MBU2001949.1 glycogen synthase [Gammaproteobacteria bacterium]MBU2131073.1 glycogen synthase [Gammaproteobacteria bacterium]MBU2188835.1 glycogen synthase [Gammaproteobacteria bacterium]
MKQRILMVAAENGALAGAKVGGMADVIRDLPDALAGVDLCADVIMPSYGFLTAVANQPQDLGELTVAFGGRLERVHVFAMPHPQVPEAMIYLLEHALWQSVPGQIYSQGSAERPFADDATKFAFLCASVATALVTGRVPMPAVLHLHDWHAGCLAMLRAFVPEFSVLKEIECVFSIHNLALQGIRPLSQDSSSFAAWFPELFASLTLGQKQLITDPRYPHCVNPMRMGIVLSDKVHLVSPSYAKEVLQPSKPEAGFFGGEGLEHDLQVKANDGKVVGILNGCVYSSVSDLPAKPPARIQVPEFKQLLSAIETALVQWQGHQAQVSGVDMIASARTQAHWRQAMAEQVPSLLLTSVGRLTDQKVLLLRHQLSSGLSVLETLLKALKQIKPTALLILLGSGDASIAKSFQALGAKYDNLLFLQGYNEALSEVLYQHGDLFLMPSSFEPCGISQMLAMRAGQPCLVHGVGGLKDTVEDGVTGFAFNGNSLDEQAEAFLQRLMQAIACFDGKTWSKVRAAAMAQRFDWHSIAEQYRQQLYCKV